MSDAGRAVRRATGSLWQPFAGPVVGSERMESEVPKPPPSKPHSDLTGVHQDERRNTDVAAELGQSAEELERARKESRARPPVDDQKSRDDRS